mmetsp:Transcript_47810/g.152543  ORF Transcript_47810/g.152543 Transcript_47810/m.152543 type:complete len:227 (+) Transcript_47810:181-861(+)
MLVCPASALGLHDRAPHHAGLILLAPVALLQLAASVLRLGAVTRQTVGPCVREKLTVPNFVALGHLADLALAAPLGFTRVNTRGLLVLHAAGLMLAAIVKDAVITDADADRAVKAFEMLVHAVPADGSLARAADVVGARSLGAPNVVELLIARAHTTQDVEAVVPVTQGRVLVTRRPGGGGAHLGPCLAAVLRPPDVPIPVQVHTETADDKDLVPGVHNRSMLIAA